MAISRMNHREEVRKKTWYLIEKLLPGGTVNMLIGGSGVGKTTWLMQMLYQWEQGIPILGHDSNPVPWVYISFDRASWEADSTLDRLGIRDWDAPIFSIEEIASTEFGFSIDGILDDYRFRDIRFFVVEGMQALVPAPARGQSQNQVEMLWMINLRKKLFEQQRAILFVTHPPKSKRAESLYTSDRSETLGSQSIGATVGTMIHILPDFDEEGQETDKRHVRWDGKKFKKFTVQYTIDQTNGRFTSPEIASSVQKHKEEAIMNSAAFANLDAWLFSLPLQPLKTSQIESFASTIGISRATAQRWLKDGERRGLLTKLSFGLWQKHLAAPEAQPGEEGKRVDMGGGSGGGEGLIQ